MRKQTKIWTTQDGQKIRICDMTDSHLLNTIAFILRTSNYQQQHRLFVLEMFDHEEAEREAGMLRHTSTKHIAYGMFPIVINMELDAQRRGLEINFKKSSSGT